MQDKTNSMQQAQQANWEDCGPQGPGPVSAEQAGPQNPGPPHTEQTEKEQAMSQAPGPSGQGPVPPHTSQDPGQGPARNFSHPGAHPGAYPGAYPGPTGPGPMQMPYFGPMHPPYYGPMPGYQQMQGYQYPFSPYAPWGTAQPGPQFAHPGQQSGPAGHHAPGPGQAAASSQADEHFAQQGAQGPDSGHQGHPKHDAHRYGQFMNLVNDLANGNADATRVMGFLESLDSRFWKGALVGISATLLLTNQAVKETITSTLSGIMSSIENNDQQS